MRQIPPFTRDFPPWALADLPQAWLKESQETHFASLNLLSPAASKGGNCRDQNLAPRGGDRRVTLARALVFQLGFHAALLTSMSSPLPM